MKTDQELRAVAGEPESPEDVEQPVAGIQQVPKRTFAVLPAKNLAKTAAWPDERMEIFDTDADYFEEAV